jgi:PGF-pre-PGF domain-containing protein
MRHRGAVVAAMVVLLAIAAPCGIAMGEEQAPGEPASFFGSASESSGDPMQSGETIVAVVDGDVSDEIIVDSAGKYGDEAAFDEKLRVDSETGDKVVFRLGDAGGPVGGSAALEAGVFEVNLTFDVTTDDDSGSTGTTTTSGGTVSGGGGGGSTGGLGSTSTGSETTAEPTSSDETRDNTSNATGNETKRTTGDGDEPPTTSIVKETVRIDDAAPSEPGTAVAFTTPTIRRIVLESGGASGTITVREFNSTSDEGPPLPGGLRVITASAITVPPAHRDEGATVRGVIETERLSRSDVDPSTLGVYRLPGDADQWQALPTTTNESDGRVIVKAETPGFSRFVIAASNASETPADATPTGGSARPPQVADAMGSVAPERTPAPSTGSDLGIVRPVGALVVLLLIIGGVGRLLTPRRRGR